MNNALYHSQAGPRRLNAVWRELSWMLTAMRGHFLDAGSGGGRRLGGPGFGFGALRRGFTVLEMLIVVTIIGFLAALALPHLPGMTRANAMSTGLQQLTSDCALARQLAMTHRSPVYMVFAPPYSAAYGAMPVNETNGYNNLLAHQYGAYALVSLRSVGDQPGRANPQYLTEWKPLPDGVFIAPWKFTNAPAVTVTVFSTNTLLFDATRVVNGLPTGVNRFSISPFHTDLLFPFPSVDATNAAGAPLSAPLPYIGFSPMGQLTTNNDEFIPLDHGRVLYLAGSGPAAATVTEVPTGDAVNNCSIIHLDWLTAKAKIERNQQR
jgi:prepilin-type N-terminal cleavage/methylation domain-containing protein